MIIRDTPESLRRINARLQALHAADQRAETRAILCTAAWRTWRRLRTAAIRTTPAALAAYMIWSLIQ